MFKNVFVPAFLMVVFLVSCGDDGSSARSYEQAFETSSSLRDDNKSSSVDNSSSSQTIDKSSSSIKNGISSSMVEKKDSSSSKVLNESSCSMKNESSSSSVEKENSSSSIKNESSSSSVEKENSSSSIENESSSSPVKTEESSSSLIDEKSSSSIQSSSSMNSIYDAENNTLTDLRDNRVYKTVTIGEQIWMAENLNYMPEDTAGTLYSGGTVCGGGEENATEDSKMCSVTGRLYLKKVAQQNMTINKYQGICPDGWSIPMEQSWKKLIEFLGNNADAKLKKNDDSIWPSDLHTNESGFSAIPSGNYSKSTGYSHNYNAYYLCWSKTTNPDKPRIFSLLDDYSAATGEKILYVTWPADVMVAVRCIKD